MRVATLPTLAAAALVLSACAEQPTSPETFTDVPAPSLAQAGPAGVGNSFVIGQGWNLNATQAVRPVPGSSDEWYARYCFATSAGDSNDFIRTKGGADYVHFVTTEVDTLRLEAQRIRFNPSGTFTVLERHVVLNVENVGKASANWYYENGYGTGVGEGHAQFSGDLDPSLLDGSAEDFGLYEYFPRGKGNKMKVFCSLNVTRSGILFPSVALW